MFRTRRTRALLAAPLVLGIVLLAPSLVSAEEEDAPKRVRIRIEREVESTDAHDTEHGADPMQILHDWFGAQLQKHTPEGKSLQEGLAAWFAQGKDAPGADLRDAFKAKGWNAEKLGQWLSHHAAGTHGMGNSMGRAGRAHAPFGQGPAMRGWFARGPWARGARGWYGMQRGRGMHRGPGMGQGRGRGGPAPQCDCPHGDQRARTHTWFGQGRLHRGPGAHGPTGPMRGGPMHGGGMHGGPRTGPWGGHAMGGMQPGRAQHETHGYIMWNDGSGWRRMELAPGSGAAPQPFRGMAPDGVPGVIPRRGPPPGPMQGQPPGARGFIRRGGATPAQGMPDLEQFRKALEMLEGLQKGAGKPEAAGQPGQPGKAGAVGPAQLRAVLEMLEQLAPQGGYRVEIGPGDATQWRQLWREAAPGKPAGQPKRVKIKPSSPKKLEVIEEIEIK